MMRKQTSEKKKKETKMNSLEQNSLSDQAYLKSFLEKMNDMRHSQVLCDVVLLTEKGNDKFYAHRSVLAASSSYFYNLYTGSCLSRFTRETIIGGIPDKVLCVVLDYIYSAEIALSEVNVEGVLCAAFQLGLESLRIRCESFLLRKLRVDNCIKMTNIGRIYSCQGLVSEGQRFIIDNFLDIQSSPEFYRLPSKDLEEIVADDDLNVRNEEQVYEAIHAWVNFDVLSRRSVFAELLSHVRLPSIARQFLLGTIDKDPLVTSSSASRELVAEALTYKMASSRDKKLTQNERTRRRFNHEVVENDGKIYVIGGMQENNNHEQTMDCYDQVTDKWTSLSAPRQRRYNHCAVALNGYLYVIGGVSKTNTILRTVERYDPRLDKWHNVTSLRTPRSGSCAVALTGQIFVMGGGSGSRKILNSCEIYSPGENKWFHGRDMKTKRDRAGATVFGGKIYVFGGSYGHVVVTSVECYDPRENDWSIISEMPFPRYGFRCAATSLAKDMTTEVPLSKPKAPSVEKLI
ncbi:PREDICTED: kelch-like protein 20 [Acropora digitifera]|uniref:kelch-like protein 20 n=1 Tax=Acropora digitifera TaxID=70779 RepID=UPI00077AE2D7|nr:PREDICTED: kelch-like protein 20 [Acropora digitifera]